MKQFLLCSILCLTTLTSFGQSNNKSNKQISKNSLETHKLILNNKKDIQRTISATTELLLMDIQKLKSQNDSVKSGYDDLIKKYGLVRRGGTIYANSFIKVNENFDRTVFEKYGVLAGIKRGNVFTGMIPIMQIKSLSQAKGIQFVEIGQKAAPTLDEARAATNVDEVHAGTSLPQSYYGDGVVVGIIDNGLDYTHPNFYNSTGNSGYRVKSVWEQNATTGTPPANYNYGRELTTQSSILAAQRDMPNMSHGTHVAGIAAGAGAGGGATTTYEGVAPKADLVFVSTTMTDVGILGGIDYIQTYANSVNKPCVINMSLGRQVGPHDGASTFDELCDSFFVGEGRILVGSAGNEGQDNLYLGKTYSSTDTSLMTFLYFPNSSNGTNGATSVDIWGNPGENFYAGAYIYNVNTNTFEDATPYLYSGAYDTSYSVTLYDDDLFLPDACDINIATGIFPNNNKPHVQMYIDNSAQDDNYRYILIEVRAANTQTKMWVNSGVFTDDNYLPPVQSGNSTSTVGEIGGTGKSIISVGAYTSKNAWTAFSSNSYSIQATVGQLASFSSKGPTADGRTKPDITAPGNVVVSSVSSFDANYSSSSPSTVYGVSNGVNDWWFGQMAGTSMSAPMVTGIMALWLEMYPDLTPDQAKQIMKNTAITDAYTGTIPSTGSNTWGWGKINAWVDIPSSVPPKPSITPNSTTICSNSSVTLSAPSGYSDYIWNTGAHTQSVTVSNAGSYKVKVKNNSGFNSPWSDDVSVTVIPAPAIPTITRNGDVLTSSAASGNQWYRNNNSISGATSQDYTITQSGNYKVAVTNANGCSSKSSTLNASPTGIENVVGNDGITIFPNPANKNLNISLSYPFSKLAYTIYDNAGKSIKAGTLTNNSKGDVKIISIGDLANGIYSIRISGKNFNYITKFTVIK